MDNMPTIKMDSSRVLTVATHALSRREARNRQDAVERNASTHSMANAVESEKRQEHGGFVSPELNRYLKYMRTLPNDNQHQGYAGQQFEAARPDLQQYIRFRDNQATDRELYNCIQETINKNNTMHSNEAGRLEALWRASTTVQPFKTEIDTIVNDPNLNLSKILDVRYSISSSRGSMDRRGTIGILQHNMLAHLGEFANQLYEGVTIPQNPIKNARAAASLKVLRHINFDWKTEGRNPALCHIIQRNSELHQKFTGWFNSLAETGIDFRPQ